MPRLKIPRKVLNPPKIRGFKPFGLTEENSNSEPVILHFEEYEAIRLCDYEMYNHNEASRLMNISRPTFTRIYASARMKFAKALVEGRKVEIEGGKVYFDSDWYHCNDCGCDFNNPDKSISTQSCPLCGSTRFEQYLDYNRPSQENRNDESFCVCTKCGYRKVHQRGIPCRDEICPSCKLPMVRNIL